MTPAAGAAIRRGADAPWSKEAAVDEQIARKPGFIAALDQSGGSTPGALRLYGIPDTAYSTQEEMFRLMHEMRVRVMTAPSFTADRILATILFERTMDGKVGGKPSPAYLRERGIVPFLKVDQGLEDEADGVRLMKPISGLDPLLARAASLGVYGTKMRSTINLPSPAGVAAIVDQQFAYAEQIGKHGLVPILEPEVLITSPDKQAAEALLRDEIAKHLAALPADRRVMLKLTIPNVPDFYVPLMGDAHVLRVVALSGGYDRDEACAKLSLNHGMIASFSRALLQDLRASMTDAEFDAALATAIAQIYEASTVKR
jgi:fructose-bisphosphate aldolase class I